MSKVLPVFPRPLYNAGRWCSNYSNLKFPEGAVIERCLRTRRTREVLPPGYSPFVPAPVVRTETASSVPANQRRYFQMASHGGGCCGRKHLSGFPTPTKVLIGSLKGQCTPRRGIEVTLTASQANRKGWEGYTWHEILIELGWKCVFVFNNGNSGNNVRVYFFSTTERKLPK